jgi:hypothetical protein
MPDLICFRWMWPSIFSSPQFLAMGPLYHTYSALLGSSNLAVIPTALTESLISFGSQSRNAQQAYNVTVAASQRVPLQPPWDPRGFAFVPHTMRNMCAMSGIRVLTHPCTEAIERGCAAAGATPDRATVRVAADFISSIAAAALSMPFNQLFNYHVTQPVDGRTLTGVLSSSKAFLWTQYAAGHNE